MTYVRPTFSRVYKIGWSFIWRYLIVAFIILGGTALLNYYYPMLLAGVIDSLKIMEQSIATLGYWETVTAYPSQIFVWFFVRFLIGFFITYFIMKSVIGVVYRDFTLKLVSSSEKTSSCKCGALSIAWAFYWRLYVLVLGMFILSLFVISPQMMVSHFWYISAGYVFVAFLVIIPFVFKKVLNRSFGGSVLMMEKK